MAAQIGTSVIPRANALFHLNGSSPDGNPAVSGAPRSSTFRAVPLRQCAPVKGDRGSAAKTVLLVILAILVMVGVPVGAYHRLPADPSRDAQRPTRAILLPGRPLPPRSQFVR